jgi:hypothetical protein
MRDAMLLRHTAAPAPDARTGIAPRHNWHTLHTICLAGTFLVHRARERHVKAQYAACGVRSGNSKHLQEHGLCSTTGVRGARGRRWSLQACFHARIPAAW